MFKKNVFNIKKKIRLFNIIVSSFITLKHNYKRKVYILILCSIYN